MGNLSLPTQQRICREYCDKNGWDVVSVFIEEGESAKSTDRPAFQNALSFCHERKNNVTYLVVHSVSRFARNHEDHVIVAATLRKSGVKLRSATEPIDDSYIGKFMETVLAGFAQLDNEMKAERSAAGMRSALEIGRWTFHAPLGYLNDRDAADNPIIIVDQQRGPLVQKAFQQFATGLYTQRQVREAAMQAGLRTLKGDKLSIQMFAYLLKNPFYTGWLTMRKWGFRKQGDFEPLVDQETFDKVQAILAGRRPTVVPDKRNRADLPLRGTLICATCGGLLTGSYSTGRSRKKFGYYRCWRKCATISVRSDKVEAQFLDELHNIGMKQELRQLFSAIVLDVWRDKRANMEEIRAAREHRLKELELRRQRLLDVFIYKNAISQDVFQDQSSKLESDIAALRAEVNDGQTDELDMEAVLEFAQQMMADAVRFWQSAPLDQKQRLQKVLSPGGIKVSHDGIVRNAINCPIFNGLQTDHVDSTNLESLIISSWNQIVANLRQIYEFRQYLPAAA